MSEPVLSKRQPRQTDYMPMTWDMFLNLREWAKLVAEQTGFPVYLVGSALYKEIPRDIDASVIMPAEEYERRYGNFPEEWDERDTYMKNVFKDNVKYYFSGLEALGGRVSFDLKFCPDNWFVDKDKLLLASPW